MMEHGERKTENEPLTYPENGTQTNSEIKELHR